MMLSFIGRCRLTNVCKPLPMWKEDVHMPRLISLSQCTHSTFDFHMPWLMSSDVGRCSQAKNDVALAILKRHRLCLKSLVVCDSICRCRSPQVHKLCLMRAGHDRCHLDSTRTPYLLRSFIGRCRLTLANIICLFKHRQHPMIIGHN